MRRRWAVLFLAAFAWGCGDSESGTTLDIGAESTEESGGTDSPSGEGSEGDPLEGTPTEEGGGEGSTETEGGGEEEAGGGEQGGAEQGGETPR